VDEVLAVGDAQFQKKCLGKMSDVAGEGRTVLFVSHNMGAVNRLCGLTILLEQGVITEYGESSQVVASYLGVNSRQAITRFWDDIQIAPGDDVARLRSISIKQGGVYTAEVDITNPVEIETEYWNLKSSRTHVVLIFSDGQGVELFTSADNPENAVRPKGTIRSVCRIPGNLLAEGRVDVLVSIGSFNPNIAHLIERDAVSFVVVDPGQGDSVRGQFANKWPGVIRPMLAWETHYDSD